MPSATPSDAAPTTTVAPVDAQAGADAATGPKIVISSRPKSGELLTKRCVFGGDPLAGECAQYNEGMAFGTDGTLYVAVGKNVQRYKRADGVDCRFEPTGKPIALPVENPRPQNLKGTVYMRSGGVEWRLVRSGAAIYAYDFLTGMFRIDGGKAQPACVDEFGYGEVAAFGKQLVILRKGFQALKLGNKCKLAPLPIEVKATGKVFAVRDKLYLSSSKKLRRFDGNTSTEIPLDVCHASSFTACGDSMCVLDGNCPKILQLDAEGKVLRTLEDDRLFAKRPRGVSLLTTADNGNVYIRTKHADQAGGKEICETAVYELPAAVFAL